MMYTDVAPSTSTSTSTTRREPRSTELQVALSPTVAYRQRRASRAPVGWWRMLARPATVLLVIGATVPMMAVQRVTFGLAATTALSFGFVIAIQMMIGAAVIASAPARSMRMVDALDLWFVGHLPYSLWLLLAVVLVSLAPGDPLPLLYASAVLPAAWTAVIVAAFCRTILDTTRAGARWRAAAHQVATWAVALAYATWASGGWFQITGSAARLFLRRQ